MPRFRIPTLVFGLIALAVCGPGATARAEEATVSAYSVWDAEGSFYQSGPSQATFAGVLSGALVVQASDGSLDIGQISCPGMLEVNEDDWSQTGRGNCVIVTADAERIYGTFECAGSYPDGCAGKFTLTGGSGPYSGISGDGAIQFVNALPQRSAIAGAEVSQHAVGLARWPALTYRLP
jgi:hypothetical protein